MFARRRGRRGVMILLVPLYCILFFADSYFVRPSSATDQRQDRENSVVIAKICDKQQGNTEENKKQAKAKTHFDYY